MTKRMMSALVLVLLAALPVLAADEGMKPDEDWVVETYAIQVRSDSIMQFESALAAHVQMHAKAMDPAPMHVFMEVIGPHMGTYYLRSGAQHWADFDNAMHIEGDRDDVMKNIVSLTTSTASSMSVYLPKISNWPHDLAEPELVEVMDFKLKRDKAREFFDILKRMHAAIMEKDPSRHFAWERTVEGGSGPEVTLAIPHDSWADFSEPDPPMHKLLVDVYGETQSEMMWKVVDEAIVDSQSMVVMYRPDLSYTPEKK